MYINIMLYMHIYPKEVSKRFGNVIQLVFFLDPNSRV
jgi:hypothetical protein